MIHALPQHQVRHVSSPRNQRQALHVILPEPLRDVHTAACPARRARVRAPYPREPSQRQRPRNPREARAHHEEREEREAEDARVVARAVRPEAEAVDAARRGRGDVARGEDDALDVRRKERDRRADRDAPGHEEQEAEQVWEGRGCGR